MSSPPAPLTLDESHQVLDELSAYVDRLRSALSTHVTEVPPPDTVLRGPLAPEAGDRAAGILADMAGLEQDLARELDRRRARTAYSSSTGVTVRSGSLGT